MTSPTTSPSCPEPDGAEQSEIEKPYPWTDGKEQAWRAFVIDAMANADIDGKVLVENMQIVYEWGTTGKVKGQKSRTSAPELNALNPDHSRPRDK